MTGRYNNRTAVWHTIMGRSLLRQNEETMANVFDAAGYATGLFGKWHLGDNHGLRPRERGFRHVVTHGGGGVGQTPDFWGNDYFDDTYVVNGKPTRFEGYCTDVWFREAIRFIRDHRDEPFFVYLSTNAPHGPFHVAPRYAEPYANNPEILNANFYGMIANIDENIGRLDRQLAELGLRENTLFLFMTDNGTAAGFDPRTGEGFNAAMRGRKGSQYDGGHRVPCFIRWPAELPANQDVSQLTAHIDLLPTLMDLCGIRERKGLPLDGKSLAPLLRGNSRGGNSKSGNSGGGNAEDWPERILVVDNQRENFPRKFKKYAVMTDRWRLCSSGSTRELYDIQKDPSQTQNVLKQFPQVAARLSQGYADWWNSQEADFVLPQPIQLGAEAENAPEVLTAHDWQSYDALKVWDQPMIRQGARASGAWCVEVMAPGTYEICLRRWPKEENAIINKSLPIRVTSAALSLSEVHAEKPIRDDTKEVVFTMDLKAGLQMLKAQFRSSDGESVGAYYAYVRKL